MLRIRRAMGFTLVELAIVTAIIGLLLTGLLMTATTQMEVERIRETRQTLETVRSALMGFAIANGRLPCPAAPSGGGGESPTGGVGGCTNSFNGFVPGRTLGVTPTNAEGYVVDGWGNRMRYAVADNGWGGNYLASPNGMKTATMASISAATLLIVCPFVIGNPSGDCGSGGPLPISNKVPALVFSYGPSGPGGATGVDRAENNDGTDRVFVSRESGANFDHLVTWISLNVLFAKLADAGLLP